jgi:carbon storage regulator
MLVLTRKTGQKLLIGPDVEIKVLETHGDSVKIGITAPKSVAIYREELYLEIMKTNQDSNRAPDKGQADMDALSHVAKLAPKKGTAPLAPSISVKPKKP